MKLRIRGSSLRLRLGQAEVARLADVGRVDDAIAFAGATLAYSIECTGTRLGASFDGRRIHVTVPEATVKTFCETDQVGFEGTDGPLQILVEKDWQCLKPRDEDETDNYPHPQAR